MKERPILFSGEMVRALIAGRKTQTRRALNARDKKLFDVAAQIGECSDFIGNGAMDENDQSYAVGLSRFGQPGDRLWVKETWADAAKNVDPAIAIAAGYKTVAEAKQAHARWAFRADYDNCIGPLKWTPSIFMPRWASRITLEITAVRVERLNDVSEADAKAEGIFYHVGDGNIVEHTGAYRKAYQRLWDGINGPLSHMENPWVWVIEFKRITS